MRTCWAILLSMGLFGFLAVPCRAGVIVLVNRSSQEVQFNVVCGEAAATEYRLPPRELASVRVNGRALVGFMQGAQRRLYHVEPNTAHFFGDFPNGLDMQEIGLGTPNPEPQPPVAAAVFPVVLRVKILVDEEEPRANSFWAVQLRRRVETASAFLERHCHIKLEVVAADTWQSDNGAGNFEELFRDFERKVRPDPGRLAIGFTSQRVAGQSNILHLGRTRYPFHPYILIQEWWPRTETDRLEVLLHELGHFLGAVHSPEPDSVMRQQFSTGQHLRRRLIGYDPVNALIMSLIAEELASHEVRDVSQLSLTTRKRLLQIYGEMEKALPDDPVAAAYQRRLLDPVPAGRRDLAAGELPLEGAKLILATVVGAAARNQRLPFRVAPRPGEAVRRSGDDLTELLIREAAAAARHLPKDQAGTACALALGVALDTSDMLRQNPLFKSVWQQLETDQERRERLAVLGIPTIRGRHDLAQHFAVSTALTALAGAKIAETAGVLKEQADMRPGGSGFSFADLAADFAGIAFASRLCQPEPPLALVAASFSVAEFLPDFAELPEGLTSEQFVKQFGSFTDDRFRAQLAAVWQRVHATRGLRNLRHTDETLHRK